MQVMEFRLDVAIDDHNHVEARADSYCKVTDFAIASTQVRIDDEFDIKRAR